jgi:glycosyltransferase involved in cell wall biosynthesis
MPNIEEVLTHGDNAWLFDAVDGASFASALSALSEDPALRHRLAVRARASIGELGLTWRSNAQRVAALGAALMAGRPVPAAPEFAP